MRKFEYSGLSLMLSIALIALAMFVKLTKAQFLVNGGTQEGNTCKQVKTHFSFK